ncbi:uncharacterized protein BJ171DRAFT_292546 [Polychytrium aggregatum]|uniref:uncharacterized protein n=1 Tax=Polychytrium aggregatum TaxID=110093 RepID=UPI0022FF3F8C|nr:uncharacterized protein BJ171DRAFT_292546 [Polychytrium aggregatum]KAI9207163.1 hypothetical protein BJ171DRAFT_292546 [Polychytrium aggregatum]
MSSDSSLQTSSGYLDAESYSDLAELPSPPPVRRPYPDRPPLDDAEMPSVVSPTATRPALMQNALFFELRRRESEPVLDSIMLFDSFKVGINPSGALTDAASVSDWEEDQSWNEGLDALRNMPRPLSVSSAASWSTESRLDSASSTPEEIKAASQRLSKKLADSQQNLTTATQEKQRLSFRAIYLRQEIASLLQQAATLEKRLDQIQAECKPLIWERDFLLTTTNALEGRKALPALTSSNPPAASSSVAGAAIPASAETPSVSRSHSYGALQYAPDANPVLVHPLLVLNKNTPIEERSYSSRIRSLIRNLGVLVDGLSTLPGFQGLKDTETFVPPPDIDSPDEEDAREPISPPMRPLSQAFTALNLDELPFDDKRASIFSSVSSISRIPEDDFSMASLKARKARLEYLYRSSRKRCNRLVAENNWVVPRLKKMQDGVTTLGEHVHHLHEAIEVAKTTKNNLLASNEELKKRRNLLLSQRHPEQQPRSASEPSKPKTVGMDDQSVAERRQALKVKLRTMRTSSLRN